MKLPKELEKCVLSFLDVQQFKMYISVSSSAYNRNTRFIRSYQNVCNKFIDTTFETEGDINNIHWKKSYQRFTAFPKKNINYKFLFDDIEWHIKDLKQMKDFDFPIYDIENDIQKKREKIFSLILS